MKRKFLFYLCSLMLVLALGIGFVTKAPVYANVNTYEEITEDTSGDDATGEEPTDDTTGDGSGDEVVEGEVELALYWAEDSSTELSSATSPDSSNELDSSCWLLSICVSGMLSSVLSSAYTMVVLSTKTRHTVINLNHFLLISFLLCFYSAQIRSFPIVLSFCIPASP